MSDAQALQARKMWELGLDTSEIADVLDVPEALVGNSIDGWLHALEAAHG